MNNKAEVTRMGIFDMQVCVPANWSNKRVINFANAHNLCGTRNGWMIRKEGDPLLEGNPERTKCSEREGFVHIMLDA